MKDMDWSLYLKNIVSIYTKIVETKKLKKGKSETADVKFVCVLWKSLNKWVREKI